MPDSDKPIFYRSSGILFGTYLPSEEDIFQGVVMSEQGLFPVSISKYLLKFFNLKPENIRRKHHFYCWAYGLPEAPHYRFHLIGRTGKDKISELYSEKNIFLSQGIITERNSEQVIIRVQKNLRPYRTSEEIEKSINYLIIKNCPGKVRNSQFWSFRNRLQDGFLHFESGEILATAKIAKSYLKIPTSS